LNLKIIVWLGVDGGTLTGKNKRFLRQIL